jgi:RHS repeat-associated protein
VQGISLYHYDVLGRFLSETTVGAQPSRDYVWAGSIPIAQIDHWVPLGNMLQMGHCHAGADGKIDWVTYLNTDGVGTPRTGTDVAKNVVWRWDGEAFGETAPTQAVPSGAYPVIVNLRNPGQYADQETGLFYNMARYYNPQAGRYIASDPIGLGGGLNTYAYADGNPISKVDPSGLDWIYYQSTGHLSQIDPNGMDMDAHVVATGYAGINQGLNNPAAQDQPFVGPLPQGTYYIGPQQDNGNLLQSMVLTPDQANQMYGRDNFLIHGAHRNDQNNSSNGCIVVGRSTRDLIGNSGDNVLQVVQ